MAILTRPAGRNEALAARLRNAGWDVRLWPALLLDTLPAPAAGHPRPEDFDLVIFVSGNAARIYLGQVYPAHGDWPAATMAATVGPSSARSLLSSGLFGANTTVLYPDKAAPTHDSEALWRVIRARAVMPRKVLLLRGTRGRDWLADQLRQAGAEVTVHAIYRRLPAQWDAAQLESVRLWAAQGRQVTWLMTSAEGIDAIGAQLTRAGLQTWWPQCRYVITHPVLRRCLPLAGEGAAAMVKECMPADEAIFEAFAAA
ncbi:uroporphyrinogen-III synthase [Bordetella holmesii CDC-H643-BH]|uniref:Uroporphyrinogen-III synthase n=1 Tax=Bordetella holmesii CDC-H585-BH TaxID=1331206 RepID=A0A158M394_9BORD|nr:uroporphyrinogen-III synthase [Bordetella holmesii H620]KAK80113.1 uroporphyrinogen-III synthase [Bordetella holmesii CDC-H809-BH]KAK90426.1 uroporphyrinogen-III synthase [Bordetella holmesii CDC-H585-BH]KCV03525.1 uroporphyrinogen-III synthase [Bordetella holmesii CDC-H719-BH]KCV07853.1 uroporphyrinogen-III synthase [Bordetella holmesii CDC-H629-BH]KCV09935.1 uroporphyrinogen-III synthase [Bordetella holmesii CDC-H785-BH]KCV13362.1 uroporphyrinogen-III synthase [Bordetella holmesii CDC-H6